MSELLNDEWAILLWQGRRNRLLDDEHNRIQNCIDEVRLKTDQGAKLLYFW